MSPPVKVTNLESLIVVVVARFLVRPLIWLSIRNTATKARIY